MKSVVQRRTCIILALTLPGLLVMLSAAYGQRRGPGPAPVVVRPNVPPRPVFVPPMQPGGRNVMPPQQVWITVWSCSNCRAELSRGGGPPAINTCPSCGASLVNQAPVQAQLQNPQGAAGAGEGDLSYNLAIAAVIGVSVLIAMACGVLVFLLCRSRPGLDVKNFERLAIAEFEPAMTRHGFALESVVFDKTSCDITYGDGERYVWISARSSGKTKAPYFNVLLGEGDRDFAAREANAVSLWEMKTLQERSASERRYVIRENRSMRRVLARANDDLASCEGGFLSGRTEQFHETRRLLADAPSPQQAPLAEDNTDIRL